MRAMEKAGYERDEAEEARQGETTRREIREEKETLKGKSQILEQKSATEAETNAEARRRRRTKEKLNVREEARRDQTRARRGASFPRQKEPTEAKRGATAAAESTGEERDGQVLGHPRPPGSSLTRRRSRKSETARYAVSERDASRQPNIAVQGISKVPTRKGWRSWPARLAGCSRVMCASSCGAGDSTAIEPARRTVESGATVLSCGQQAGSAEAEPGVQRRLDVVLMSPPRPL